MKTPQMKICALLVISLVGVMGFQGQPSTISDLDIQSALTRRLAMDGRMNRTNIHIHVDNGRVMLTGTVETLMEKGLAENLVVSTYGVKAVNNQLTVKPAPTKDLAVEQAVREALKATPVLQTSDIQVSVSDGVVLLKGTVEKQSQSHAAEFAARTVPGLVSVVNLLKVMHARPDHEIEKDVVFYLQSSSLVNIDDVDYVVKDGVVRLKGTIDNLSHAYAVANDLEKIHGVKSVDVSRMTVKIAARTTTQERTALGHDTTSDR